MENDSAALHRIIIQLGAFFLLNLVLEARAEILTKIVFLVDLKTPKGHFEIN